MEISPLINLGALSMSGDAVRWGGGSLWHHEVQWVLLNGEFCFDIWERRLHRGRQPEYVGKHQLRELSWDSAHVPHGDLRQLQLRGHLPADDVSGSGAGADFQPGADRGTNAAALCAADSGSDGSAHT